MKTLGFSVQRQCDGLYTDVGETPRCLAVLEVVQWFDVAVDDEDEVKRRLPAVISAWENAALALGWRRQHGVGSHHVSRPGDPEMVLVVPSTRVWVSCGACSKVMRLGLEGALGIDALAHGLDE